MKKKTNPVWYFTIGGFFIICFFTNLGQSSPAILLFFLLIGLALILQGRKIKKENNLPKVDLDK